MILLQFLFYLILNIVTVVLKAKIIVKIYKTDNVLSFRLI